MNGFDVDTTRISSSKLTALMPAPVLFEPGTLQITATRPPNSGGVSGQGSVVTLTFMAKAPGQSPLTITRGGARDPSMQAITVNGAQAVVTIQ